MPKQENKNMQPTDTGALRVSLHRKIANAFVKKITSGQWKPGRKLPPERQIARQFSASRATVRTALQDLELGGWIKRPVRHSAVVAIRHDVQPNLRIACSNSRLLDLFRCLDEKEFLLPRVHIQLIDMRQPWAIRHLLTPTDGVDLLICELKYVNCLQGYEEHFESIPQEMLCDVPFGLYASLVKDDHFTAVPLGISPMVLYYNKAMFRQQEVQILQSPWNWDQLAKVAQQFKGKGRYGFQICPSFEHLSALLASFGGELYQVDGTVAARKSAQFEPTLRFLYDLLHDSKVVPPLIQTDRVNLFTKKRCAMAVDGFNRIHEYRDVLGGDLGVAALPGVRAEATITQGFALLALKGTENLQLVKDTLRSLLSVDTQRMLVRKGASLPVRRDLLEVDSLLADGVPEQEAGLLIQQARCYEVVNIPATMAYHNEVENVFWELWLGLDTIDDICRRFTLI